MNVKNQCTQSDLYIQYGKEYAPNGLSVLCSRTVFSDVLIEAEEQSRQLLSVVFVPQI